MKEEPNETSWYENDQEDTAEYSFREYDVTSTPNDFNSKTIIDFIESGLFKIPGFQRNYVWDVKRASKLIESLVIGLPIPQVFLYEESKNNYLVIDGQQRLLTIFFFYKKRFPKKDKRFELRQIFEESAGFPDEVLFNDEYFEDFKLKLNEPGQTDINKLDGLNYATLGDFKTSFDLRTVRNIMIKQNFPDDDSAMFEIFNRLNSGGVILKPQEIRTSLYHSKFYNQLYKLNMNTNWRQILNKAEPDLHMKDIEILLRAFAMLIEGDDYRPSMTRFLNRFSKKTKTFAPESLEYFKSLFENFCKVVISLNKDLFITKGKFNITEFESIFVALCTEPLKAQSLDIKTPTIEKIGELQTDQEFKQTTQQNTTNKRNVDMRLKRAKEILQ